MSRNNRSPQLQPYFDDQQPDSEDELELFDFGETSNNRFGSAQNEEDDDLKNYETFYCADPLISDNDGMMMLSEQVCMPLRFNASYSFIISDENVGPG